MKYKYLDLKPLPQKPIEKHVYIPTEKDIALSAQMEECTQRIEEELKDRWRPDIGERVVFMKQSEYPVGYSEGEQGTVSYLGNGWFQVIWDKIGRRSYGLNCIVSEWIKKAP